jgi:hypothetical protein
MRKAAIVAERTRIGPLLYIACIAVTAPRPALASGEATRAMGLRMQGKCRAKIWRREETAKPRFVETRTRAEQQHVEAEVEAQAGCLRA